MFKYCKKYKAELLESVIPFWEQNCIDEKYGGYFTFLDRDGNIYDTAKYMWMQWRIVYMFAELAMSDYCSSMNEEWLKIAENGFDFLETRGKDENGWYYFALNREGKPIIAPYNIASEFFVVMGSASLYKATHDERYKHSALQSMETILSRRENPKGKWNKQLPDDTHRFTLGNYMFVVNLGTILEDYIGIYSLKNEIENSIDTILEYFWQEEYNVVFENINEDFSVDLASCDGRHIIPGHGLESMWFILEYAEKTNNCPIIEKTCNIIQAILEFSWDKEYGGIYYFMDVLGKPHVELSWDMKLWWVHNEALIASLYAYVLTKRDTFLDWFKKIDSWTWSHFPDRDFGEWYGYLNRRGEPTHQLKGGKWKTFFHLPRCLVKCETMLEKLKL